ncbi:MAG: hypothetical protein U9R47_06880, partial [Actinomycetota bacterium]|nr:hypothetical protein [Actinomycetota bacterium]
RAASPDAARPDTRGRWMMDARDPMDRLSSAFRIEVDPETKERHLAEMGAAIRTAPPTPVPAGFGLRRRVAAAVAAVFIVAPAGMALAAEDAVPGDFLYPVKEITERVRSLVDPDIEATHRVEEVERLVFRRAPIHAVTRAVERAESATLQLAEPGELRLRLERARERLQQDEERRPAEGNGSGGGRQEADSNSGKTDPGEGSGSTVPSGSRGSTEQDQNRSGEADTTDDQDQSVPGSGGSAGSMAGSGGSSSTTALRNSGEPKHP